MHKLTSSKAAETIGINVETLRYYERIGLAPVPSKTSGGHRIYSAEDMERLFFIRRARSLGFSIDEIRVLLGTASNPDKGCVRELAKGRLSKLAAELEEKRIAISILAHAIGECEGNCCSRQIIDVLKNADKFASLTQKVA